MYLVSQCHPLHVFYLTKLFCHIPTKCGDLLWGAKSFLVCTKHRVKNGIIIESVRNVSRTQYHMSFLYTFAFTACCWFVWICCLKFLQSCIWCILTYLKKFIFVWLQSDVPFEKIALFANCGPSAKHCSFGHLVHVTICPNFSSVLFMRMLIQFIKVIGTYLSCGMAKKAITGNSSVVSFNFAMTLTGSFLGTTDLNSDLPCIA